jgi:hypothetical protein
VNLRGTEIVANRLIHAENRFAGSLYAEEGSAHGVLPIILRSPETNGGPIRHGTLDRTFENDDPGEAYARTQGVRVNSRQYRNGPPPESEAAA